MIAFNFNEANILKQNLFNANDTKEILIKRLTDLFQTTDEPTLRESVYSLIKKVKKMTPEQISGVYKDIQDKKMIATVNYRVY